MKNLQVKKQINKKLKLYRSSLIGSISFTILGELTINYVSQKISNALFGNNISLEKLIFIFGFSFPAMFLLISNNIVIYPFDEVRFLKLLKKELKNGVNRFDNISGEDFEIEFAKEKKKYMNNKVK